MRVNIVNIFLNRRNLPGLKFIDPNIDNDKKSCIYEIYFKTKKKEYVNIIITFIKSSYMAHNIPRYKIRVRVHLARARILWFEQDS